MGRVDRVGTGFRVWAIMMRFILDWQEMMLRASRRPTPSRAWKPGDRAME